MIVLRIIRAIFGGGCLFTMLGLILIVVAALWSAFMDTEMEDGTTMRQTFQDAGNQIHNAWDLTEPSLEGIDYKQGLKNNAIELEQYGRDEFEKFVKKTQPIIDEYKPIIDEKIEAVEEILEEYEKEKIIKN